ncbi:N-glycosylation protein EOS1 [Nakaseomyces bracarensis]|uniref:N-glycosylation protein EOS1 n=1 Tax=Nakaseomyces bracarensis TaxID=273131 RepID=A0ABR4NXV8_9SACH
MSQVDVGPMGKESLRDAYQSIKKMSLDHLSAKQHLLMALCRDVSMLPPLYYVFKSLKRAWRISVQTTIKLYEPQSLRESLMAFWQTYMVANISNSVEFNNLRMSENVVDSSTNWESVLFTALTKARASEHLLCALWCIVSLYLTYAILDSLMVRWIVKYSTLAAILRMFSMSMIIVTFESMLLASLSPDRNYFLHTWILISCILTAVYIWQSYLTSDLNYVRNHKAKLRSLADSSENTGLIDSSGNFDVSLQVNDDDNNYSEPDSEFEMIVSGEEHGQVNRRTVLDNTPNSRSSTPSAGRNQRRLKKKKNLDGTFNFTSKRYIDLYSITVFCVVPVGLASFITMVGLLRNLFIQRLDVEQLGRMLNQSYKP